MVLRQKFIMQKFVTQSTKWFAFALFAGLCLPASAQNYTITEWPTPSASSLPLHLAVLNSNQFYFTEANKNRIGGVDVSTNAVTEWPLPKSSMPHSIVLDANNNLAFCAVSGNYVAVMNPNLTKDQLTVYPVPTADSSPIHLDTELSLEQQPEYFFSEAVGNKIGLLDPVAGTITEWDVPTASSTPRGVSLGAGTQVFFAELSTHKIGMLDTSTNNMTEWTIPGVRQVEHLHFVNGQIYFGDLATSVVGILNPTDNQVTEWNAPTQDADIPDVYVVGTTFYFSERGAGKIGFLNPAQQAGTVKTAKVVVTPESPTVSLVTPTIATLKATTTIETPTVTNLTGTISGGFTEWTIPSSDSGPLGIVGQGGTPVFFSEYYGNKVAELTNSDPSGMLK